MKPTIQHRDLAEIFVRSYVNQIPILCADEYSVQQLKLLENACGIQLPEVILIDIPRDQEVGLTKNSDLL